MKKTRLIQENRLVAHVQPVINREVIVHRQNTLVRNITLHQVNTTNRTQLENRHEVVNRYAQGSVRYVNEYREVRGVNCNCGCGATTRVTATTRSRTATKRRTLLGNREPLCRQTGGAVCYSLGLDALDRNRAEEVALANFHANVAHNAVGGGKVEIEIRQHEVIEIVGAFHEALVRPKRKGDFAIS